MNSRNVRNKMYFSFDEKYIPNSVFTYPTSGQDLCLRMFQVDDKYERIIKVDEWHESTG
jgi:hypothetical protein